MPKTPAQRKDARLRRLYNISLDDYEHLYRIQGGVCAICHQPETQRIRGVLQPLSVDHSHVTGRVRGLLCHAHNTAIGKFSDNIDHLRRAIAYLRGELTHDV